MIGDSPNGQAKSVTQPLSVDQIQNARFVRKSVEMEIIKIACANWGAAEAATLEENLVLQRQALATNQIEDFHRLDYDFHRLICELSGHPLAFETIQQSKQQVDHLCVQSLAKSQEAALVLEDHENIARALFSKSPAKATRRLCKHVGRLDTAINDVHEAHPVSSS